MSKISTFINLMKNDRKTIGKAFFDNFSRTSLSRLIPDKQYLKIQYRVNFGKKLDLNNPQTFNEKLQWLKVNDRKPLYNRIADKYDVREYVKALFGEEYLIPIYAMWEKVEDIDFDILPNEFVMKCTHDSGSVVVCRDKSSLDKEKAINKIRQGFSRNLYHYAREWQYKDIKPRIIVEKLLVEDDDIGKSKPTGIVDYKFFVFNGVPKFYYASRGLENHATASISFYDLNGNKMPFSRSDYKDFGCAITPIHLDEMIKLAQKAGEAIGSDFIRVDFYEIGGKVYFSEFTLHPCAGLMPIVPEEWDSILGDWIKLHKNK